MNWSLVVGRWSFVICHLGVEDVEQVAQATEFGGFGGDCVGRNVTFCSIGF